MEANAEKGPHMTPTDVLTQEQAASYLRCSRYTVSRLLPREHGLGDGWCVSAASLHTFIQQRYIGPEGPEVVADKVKLPKLYTLPEVAGMTGFTLRTLQDGARKRRFEHHKIGGKRVMTAEQIQKLFGGTFQATAESAPPVDPAIQAELDRRASRGRRRAA